MFGTAVLDAQHGPATIGLDRADRVAGLGRRQHALECGRHDIGGEIAHVAAIEASRLVDRLFHRQGFEQAAALKLFQNDFAVFLALDQNDTSADFFGLLAELDLLVVLRLDGLFIDVPVDRVFDEDIAQDTVAGSGQTALRSDGFIQPLTFGGLGQQTLIDDFFEGAREEVRGHVERLARSDLPLRHGLCAHVR